MAPTASTSARPARHAFSKAVRGVIDQTNGGDAQMNDVSSGPGPVRSRAVRKVGRSTKDRNEDAMKVDRAVRAGTLAARLGPAKLSTSARAAAAASRVNARLPAHEMWREFVKARYNAEAQFLDLSRMADDPIVRKHNLSPPGASGAPSRSGAAIFKLASQLKPPPITISLAHNNLTNTIDFQTLPHYLPDTRNLSFEGNSLKHMRDIEPFAGKRGRLTQLRELILAGNPLRDAEFAAGKGDKFQNDILRRFPSLEILDGVPLVKISFDNVNAGSSTSTSALNAVTQFPVTMQAGFIPADVQGLVGEFCTRFFNHFDSSRGALAVIYAPTAEFSMSVNAAIPPRAKVEGWHTHPSMPNQRKLEWTKWFEAGSRNLSRLRDEGAVKTLSVGIEAIGLALGRIPGTRHDLTQPSHFIVDGETATQPDGSVILIVTVHGQFTETETEGIRSFDRTFVLAPAAPGSPAQASGWPVVILNDMWTVRAFSHPSVWTPGARLAVQDESKRAAAAAAAATAASTPQPPSAVAFAQPQPAAAPAANQVLASLPPDQQAILATLSDVQRGLVLEVCGRTGLGVMFAGQCLEGNEWDLTKALANFEVVKGQLPADAFVAR